MVPPTSMAEWPHNELISDKGLILGGKFLPSIQGPILPNGRLFFGGMYYGGLNFILFGILSEDEQGLNETILKAENKFSLYLKKESHSL